MTNARRKRSRNGRASLRRDWSGSLRQRHRTNVRWFEDCPWNCCPVDARAVPVCARPPASPKGCPRKPMVISSAVRFLGTRRAAGRFRSRRKHGRQGPVPAWPCVAVPGHKERHPPVWSATHVDQGLWPVVALMTELPDMDAAAYADLKMHAEGAWASR